MYKIHFSGITNIGQYIERRERCGFGQNKGYKIKSESTSKVCVGGATVFCLRILKPMESSSAFCKIAFYYKPEASHLVFQTSLFVDFVIL